MSAHLLSTTELKNHPAKATPKREEPCMLPNAGQPTPGVDDVMGFPGGSAVRNPPASAGDTGDTGWSPGSGRFLEDTHSRILSLEKPMDRGAWRGQSMGLQKIRQDLATEEQDAEICLIYSWHLFCLSPSQNEMAKHEASSEMHCSPY